MTANDQKDEKMPDFTKNGPNRQEDKKAGTVSRE
jgi:hypothetical protein